MLKKLKKALLSVLSALMVVTLVNVPISTKASSEIDNLANELILYYRDYQEKAETDLGRVLSEIKKIDENQYTMWKNIISYWHEVRSDGYVTNGVPNDMPQDNSLVILILGSGLNPDGSMNEELIGRLGVGLEVANAYPNAYIAVTGGATASENPDATEGGEMAKWLLNKGIDASRLIVEEQAPDTVGNVNYVYNILKRDEYSSVDSICVVTGDYHVPRGLLLAYAKTQLGQLNGDKPLNIVGNAGYFGGGKLPETADKQATALASMMGVTLGSSVELSTPISLAITQNTPYETGKELDLTVVAKYNTGYSREVTELVEITNFDSTLDNTQTITVSYTENNATISGNFTLSSNSKEFLDTTSLENKIAEAEAIDTTKYTSASVNRLTTALNNAKNLLNDEGITLEKVEEAKANLTSAIQRLVYNTSTGKTNLVAGIVPTASTNQNNAKKVTNSKLTDFWISTGSSAAGESLIFDLGQESIIEEINVHSYYDDSKGYSNLEDWDCLFDLYASNDQETWTKIASQDEYNNVTGEGYTFLFEPRLSYRYVKLVGKEAYSTYNKKYTYSLLIEEVLIYGTTDASDPNIGNIALGKPTSESLGASANESYYKVVDGSTDGYWAASSYKNRPWVCIDLEDVYDLSSLNVVTLFSSKRIYNFELYTSIDGETFTYLDAYTGSDYSTKDGVTFDLSNKTVYARYIRLVGTYHSKNAGFHLSELRVYGSLANDDEILSYQIKALKDELQALINECESTYVETDYSDETWKTYSDAIASGKEIITNENATLVQVENKINEINNAVSGLKLRPDETKEAGSFRVASFNLAAYNHPNTKAILEDLLIRYSIDYAGLQEVDKYTSRNDVDVLKSFVGDYFTDYFFGKFMDYQGGEYGVGLISTTDIKATENGQYVFDDVKARGWAKMIVEVDGKEVAIYVTHLALDYHQNRSDVEQMLKVLADDPTEYKILTGDFNCHKEWMYDFLVDYNLANGKDGVWLNTAGSSWKEGSVSDAYGLDNIIATRNIEITKVQAIDSTKYSDHNMIFAEMKLLDEAVPSKEYLNIVVNDAKELIEEKYTTSTWKAVSKAVSKAESLNTSATQAEINKVLFELQEAIANLERIIPNVSTDKTIISVGQTENTLVNINDGDIYTCWEAADNPDAIILDLESLYEIDEIQVFPKENTPRYYYYKVYTSKDGINYDLVGEKTTNEIEDYKGATYNVDGMARYVKVEMTANSVNNGLHLGELNVYASLVEDITDLKEALKELIDSYSQLSEDDYIPTTYEALQEALANANSVYENPLASKESVNNAYSALEEAFENLVEYADKTELNALIEANKNKDLSSYSEKTSNEFLEALKNATKVSEDPYVSQAMVDEATLILQLAIEDLIAPINIATYMIVTTQSNKENAQLITDGNNNTAWTAANSNEFVIVDLDGVYALDKVIVSSSLANVYVSEDKETWVQLESNSRTADIVYALDKLNARYIKIESEDVLSVSEVQAYGEEVGNIALDKPFTSFAAPNVYDDRKANDGNRYTYWGAGKSKDQPWFTVDLEGIYDLSSVNVITHWQRNDRYYRFKVYTSIDGETFELLSKYEGTDTSTIQGYKFNYENPTYARYIKVVGTSNSANTYFHLSELRAYGELVDYDAVQMKEQLKQYIEELKDINLTNYTDESVKVLEDSIENANAIIRKYNATLEEVVKTYEDVKDAVNRLALKEADYTAVNKALDKVPTDLSIYTDETVKVLKDAINAVVKGKKITEQAEVDSYAGAIEAAILKLNYKLADYGVVNDALNKIPANLSIYTEATVNVLENAVNSVEKDKNILEQDKVDEMAKAILDAINGLEIKKESNSNGVDTGDNSSILFYELISIISLFVIFFFIKRKKESLL